MSILLAVYSSLAPRQAFTTENLEAEFEEATNSDGSFIALLWIGVSA